LRRGNIRIIALYVKLFCRKQKNQVAPGTGETRRVSDCFDAGPPKKSARFGSLQGAQYYNKPTAHRRGDINISRNRKGEPTLQIMI